MADGSIWNLLHNRAITDELYVHGYQAKTDHICDVQNERYNGDRGLRQLNAIRGRNNCASLCTETLSKHITKGHSLKLNISDGEDAKRPHLMSDSTLRDESGFIYAHSMYMIYSKSCSIPVLGSTFKKCMFQGCSSMTEASQTGKHGEMRDLKGFAVDFRPVLEGCDLKNKSETNMKINVAIIDALKSEEQNSLGMIIGFLNVALVS